MVVFLVIACCLGRFVVDKMCGVFSLPYIPPVLSTSIAVKLLVQRSLTHTTMCSYTSFLF